MSADASDAMGEAYDKTVEGAKEMADDADDAMDDAADATEKTYEDAKKKVTD